LQVVCNSKSSFLAAADDNGEVKVCLVLIPLVLSVPIVLSHLSALNEYIHSVGLWQWGLELKFRRERRKGLRVQLRGEFC